MAMALSPGEIFKAAGGTPSVDGSWSAWRISTSSGRPSPVSTTCGGPARTQGLLDVLARVTPKTIEPPVSFEFELVRRSGAAHRRSSSEGVGGRSRVLAGRVQAQ